MVFNTFKNHNYIGVSSVWDLSVSNQLIMNEIFLPLGYSCFVFWVYLSAFVYVLYLIVSMFLSIYTSVSGNFGYFLSVPSIYDSLAICMFWINSQATPGTKASRFLYLMRWKIYLHLYLCQLQFPRSAILNLQF